MKRLSLFFVALITSFSIMAQDETKELLNLQTAPTSATPTESKAGSLVILVQRGKLEEREGGATQQYQVNSGEAIFIPTGASPTGMETQQAKPVPIVSQNIRNINDEISQKQAEITDKQTQLDNEIYQVYKAPIEGDLRLLNYQLNQLQRRRDQLDAQKTSHDIQKKERAARIPPPPNKVMTGLQVTATLNGEDKVSIKVRKSGFKSEPGKKSGEFNVDAPIGQWVQIPKIGKNAQDEDIWIKVDKGS